MLIWCLLNHARFQFLNPLPISSFLAPCSSLFVFPHVLLITIGKIIFHLFPQLPLPLSFPPSSFLAALSFLLFLIFFIPHLSSPPFLLRWPFFLFLKFFLYICCFFLLFCLFVCFFFFKFLVFFFCCCCCFNPDISFISFAANLSLSSLALQFVYLIFSLLSISSFLLFPLLLPLLLFHFTSELH